MKDIVNACVHWQLERIGNRTDPLDLKGACILGTKLLAGGRIKRLCGAVEESQPHPIADGELQRAVVSIVMLLRILLSL